VVQDEPNGELVVNDKSAKPARSGRGFGAFFGRIALFIRQVFQELRKVVTPTRQELLKYTLVVLGFVVVMMALVYGLDTLFTWLTQYVFGSVGAA
jgi:preprotein translocase subunit SecE